jgi:UDP-2-acetamido-3-amino-2,3-dideoxy-glucuronate N-acetyltransferase
VAAFDPHDSVGILDRYFPEARFFTEFGPFARHLGRLKCAPAQERLDYLAICSPSHLHGGLGQNVYVADRVKIGDGVKIQNNVSIYAGVILEDDVFCGPSMVFTNVKTPRAAFPRDPVTEYLTTRVCQGASIGANAIIVCGVRIGPWALVAAGAVVTRDVAAHALALGVPARAAGWVCRCGEALAVERGTGACLACGRGYALDEAGGIALDGEGRVGG